MSLAAFRDSLHSIHYIPIDFYGVVNLAALGWAQPGEGDLVQQKSVEGDGQGTGAKKAAFYFESTLLLSIVCSSVVCVVVVGQISCNQQKRLFRLCVCRRAADYFVFKLGNNSKGCIWNVFFCCFNCFMTIPTYLQKYIFKRFLRTFSVKMRRIYLAV